MEGSSSTDNGEIKDETSTDSKNRNVEENDAKSKEALKNKKEVLKLGLHMLQQMTMLIF